MVANDDNSQFLGEFLRERRHIRFLMPFPKIQLEEESIGEKIGETKRKFKLPQEIGKRDKDEEITTDEAKQLDVMMHQINANHQKGSLTRRQHLENIYYKYVKDTSWKQYLKKEAVKKEKV